MPDRNVQYRPRITDPDTGGVVDWRAIELRGSECEPPSGFTSVAEGGKLDLQDTRKPIKADGSHPDYKKAAQAAERAYGEDGPWWLND